MARQSQDAAGTWTLRGDLAVARLKWIDANADDDVHLPSVMQDEVLKV